MTASGQTATFDTAWSCVWNATVNGWGGWLLLHPASRCAILQVSSSARKGATRCKLRQLASIWPRTFFRSTASPPMEPLCSIARLRRAQLLPFFEKLPPCLVGMEACGSSHHWAREISKLGHEVRLMPAFYVKPYVKRGKTDSLARLTRPNRIGRQRIDVHLRIPSTSATACWAISARTYPSPSAGRKWNITMVTK